MPCPLCGDICRCSSDANTVASLGPAQAAETAVPGDASRAEDSPPWRSEVAARLNRYQTRRKPRPPRYPSLQLRFEEDNPISAVSGRVVEAPTFPQRTTASHQALALDSFADGAADPVETAASFPLPSNGADVSQETTALHQTDQLPQPTAPTTAPATARIIEFPRSWTPTPPPLDELADPVLNRDRPRILEAPDVIPPPPALGGITIEPAQQPEMERRPGIDIPLQSAPLARRVLAAGVDGVIIAAAGALFGFIFWKLTASRPPRLQIAGLIAGLSGLFWAVYQYLLLVYSGTTPGLLIARLELARFDGSPAGRRLRRWRVLASFLSAASLGMGYAWVFLDEDALCWHDRITHTYLAPKK